MAVTDLTADMLTMIRNASQAKKEAVEIKRSNLLEALLKILKVLGGDVNTAVVQNNKSSSTVPSVK